MSTAAAPTTRVESVLQRAELELWRDNIDGALDLLARAHTLAPDHRYTARAEEIRSWLRHLESRGAYAAAYEEYYRRSKGRLDLKRLERDVRILLGRKTRKTVRRVVEYPEYQLLEREIIARRLNRFRNVAFQHGLVEDVVGAMAPGSFDLAYSFAVLEHVPDVETTVGALLRTLRPGGRFCFAVPMNELMATGPVPAFQPLAGVAGHVRVFTEVGLRERFGRLPEFSLTKLPGRWRPGRYPATIAPLEYGAFFVAVSVP